MHCRPVATSELDLRSKFALVKDPITPRGPPGTSSLVVQLKSHMHMPQAEKRSSRCFALQKIIVCYVYNTLYTTATRSR